MINESTIGTFPGEKYHINVDPTIWPKQTVLKHVQIHHHTQFREELNKMLQLGAIIL